MIEIKEIKIDDGDPIMLKDEQFRTVLSEQEDTSNKIISIQPESTNIQYPSAKAAGAYITENKSEATITDDILSFTKVNVEII